MASLEARERHARLPSAVTTSGERVEAIALKPFLDARRRGRCRRRRRDGHDALRPRRLPEPLLRRAQPLEPRPGAQRPRGVHRSRAPIWSRPTPSARTASSSGRTASRSRCARSTRGRAPRARGAAGARATWRARSVRSASRSRPSATSLRRGDRRLPRAGRGPGRGRRRPVLIETMPSLDQARAALEAVRAVSDRPVVVSLTFNEEGTTFYGDKPEDVVRALEALGVPVIGANCSQGPQPMLETMQRMAAAATSAKLSAMPNAGAPGLRRRPLRLSLHARVHGLLRAPLPRRPASALVGGCCGTTPAHIKNLVRSVRMGQPSRETWSRCAAGARRRKRRSRSPREEKSPLARKLGKQFVVSVELDPPRGADPGAILEQAQYCKEKRGRRHQRRRRPARLGAHERAVAVRAAQDAGRDRHDPALHLPRPEPARHPVGPARRVRARLRNILAITGDPPKLGDYPDATAVYDVDSIGLIRIMDHLNHGCDLAGNLIGPALGHPHRLRRRSGQAGHRQGSAAARGRRSRRAPSTS